MVISKVQGTFCGGSVRRVWDGLAWKVGMADLGISEDCI